METKRLYAIRDTESGKLVANITSPGHTFWHRRGDAEEAIRRYNSRRVKPKHGRLELVTYELVEVKEDG